MSFANRVMFVLCVLFEYYVDCVVCAICEEYEMCEKYVIYANFGLYVVTVHFVIYAIHAGADLAGDAYVVELSRLKPVLCRRSVSTCSVIYGDYI